SAPRKRLRGISRCSDSFLKNTSTRPEARVPSSRNGAASIKMPRKIVVNVKNWAGTCTWPAIKFCRNSTTATPNTAKPIMPKIFAIRFMPENSIRSLLQTNIALSLSACHGEDLLEFIFGGSLVPFLGAAPRAAVQDTVAICAALHFHRLHQPATTGRPVAGGNIHMLAPQTGRAVVGVAVAGHRQPAALTGEIFH